MTSSTNHADLAPRVTTPSGTLIAGRYEILGVLGAGGMGVVYRARDTDLDEVVALKVITHELARDPGMLERFRREVKLSRLVTHRNVARVFDIGEDQGVRFFTMELVEGESLRERLVREKSLDPSDVISLASEICEGLVAAHAASVVHRDLKPDNVLIARDGRVVLTDFGIARARSAGARSGTQGISVGTPEYMAPEQLEGAVDVDGRADLYALGAMMFELLTGDPPWSGPNVMAIITARLTSEPPDPRKWARVPDALAEIVLRCMSRSPDRRYAGARELASALATCRRAERSPSDRARGGRRSAVGEKAAARVGSASTLVAFTSDPTALELCKRASLEASERNEEAVDRAVALFEQAMNRAPDDPRVHVAYASTLVDRFESGNTPISELHESLAMAERAAASPDVRVEALLVRAHVRHELGTLEGSIQDAEELVRAAPDRAEVLALRGRLLVAAGAVAEGVGALERATALAPDLIGASVDLALGFALLGNPSAASSRVDGVLASFPRSDLAWLAAARLCLWSQDARRARTLLARARTTHLGQAARIIGLLEACQNADAADAARALHEQLAEEAVALPRRCAELVMTTAEVALRGGDPARALATLENLLKFPPAYGVGWLERCPMLDSLRAAPRFEALLTRARRLAAPFRTQLREMSESS